MYIKNHLIFCISFIIFLFKIFKIFNLNINIVNFFFISLLSSIMPDIDHPNSFLGNKFKILSFLLFNFFGHRTITHSLLGVIIYFLFIVYLNFFLNFNFDIILALFLGYFSHIFCDMFTFKGIFFLWPYKIKFRIPFIYIYINKKNEYYFCIIFFIFSLFFNNFCIKNIN